jgi:hypothetical protein
MVQPYRMAVSVYRKHFDVSERLKRAATALLSHCHSDYCLCNCAHSSMHALTTAVHITAASADMYALSTALAVRLVGALYMHQQCIRHVVVHERSQYMEVRLSNA